MPDSFASHAFTATHQEHNKRLDAFLAAHLADAGISRERAKHLIKEGAVCVDGAPATSPKVLLFEGAHVTITIPEAATSLTAETGDLTILYQDAELALIDKPADLTVHPCPSCPQGTLAHRLISHFPDLARQGGSRPGIVHRLDKDTSGLILVALTERCRLALAEQFAERAIYKEYLAIVHGVPKLPQGIINSPIGRHPQKKVMMAVTPNGKEAITHWRTLYADPAGRFSVVAARILTGRTHQIRVHLTHLGHPLVGDTVYCGEQQQRKALPLLHNAGAAAPAHPAPAEAAPGGPETQHPTSVPQRQMLHAWRLALRHPFPESVPQTMPPMVSIEDGVLRCTCPPPEDFARALVQLTTHTLRVVITGSPGCGKSTLLHALAARGIPTSSADVAVKELYQPGNDGWRLLRARFGDRFLCAEKNAIDKVLLGTAMREEPGVRREVEALLHPLVAHTHKEFFREQEKAGAPLAVTEIPLYLEAGYHLNATLQAEGDNRPLPVLVGVRTPFAIRKERLKTHRGWSDETIDAIESWQWQEDEKIAACDLVVDNLGSPDELARKADGLITQLLALRAERARTILESITATAARIPFGA